MLYKYADGTNFRIDPRWNKSTEDYIAQRALEAGAYPYTMPVFSPDTQKLGALVPIMADGEQVGLTHEVVDKTLDEVLSAAKLQAETAILDRIQAQVDAYNSAHGLSFRDVYSCGLYRLDAGYEHQQFCADVWDWNRETWVAARAIQADVLAGNRTLPTLDEFLAELPVYGGAV